ncbi:MAG: MarC family protein [Duodenibacillus sp.]|jgi:membrane protein, marC family|nr:MarC family protein [Duodenibacillus sp.]
MPFSEFFAVFVKFFFILTPFFIIAVFLAMTENETVEVRHALAVRITIAVVIISLILFFAGMTIFTTLGITVDAFRIGAGALLFLSGVSLVNGKLELPAAKRSIMDLAVVPLAIPVTLGPGSVGALVVMSTETTSLTARLLTALAIVVASLAVGVLLYLSAEIKRLIGRSGISMLSKLTGLILAALSSHMMFTGIAAYLK